MKKKKKRYPEIVPKISKDKHGKPKTVYLEYDVYESIFERIKDLSKEIEVLKKKKKTSL